MTSLLDLLLLGDSALPIGSAAHSFGLETLAEEELLHPENIEAFFREYLSEAGTMETSYVRRAWCAVRDNADPRPLSDELAARRIARESRDAAMKMGQRFGRLVFAMTGADLVPEGLIYPVAFGVACGGLGVEETGAALAYLRQSVAGLISACQRLMPLGQVAAGCMMWNLKPAIMAAVLASENWEVGCFTPLPELASMRHGTLETRLFIS